MFDILIRENTNDQKPVEFLPAKNMRQKMINIDKMRNFVLSLVEFIYSDEFPCFTNYEITCHTLLTVWKMLGSFVVTEEDLLFYSPNEDEQNKLVDFCYRHIGEMETIMRIFIRMIVCDWAFVSQLPMIDEMGFECFSDEDGEITISHPDCFQQCVY